MEEKDTLDVFLGLNNQDEMNWLFDTDFIQSVDEITTEILTSSDNHNSTNAPTLINKRCWVINRRCCKWLWYYS